MGTPAVPVVLTDGVPVVSVVASLEGVVFADGVSVPWGSVATGGRVFTGEVVGVAALEHALKTIAAKSRTPRNFGNFIDSLLSTFPSQIIEHRRGGPL
jgi:hypothetical protein